MARTVTNRHKTVATIAAWIVALLIFFPILYTIITSFKTEQEAIQGFSLIPSGTLQSYADVQSQSGYFKFFLNSVILSVGSTILALIVAIPAAWSMAFSPTRRTKDILMWMLSTKMMPAVAVLFPIYIIFREHTAGRIARRIDNQHTRLSASHPRAMNSLVQRFYSQPMVIGWISRDGKDLPPGQSGLGFVAHP